MDTNINHLPHSHCMCGIMNVVFRSTSGECGRPFDVKVIWFKYTFFLLLFFLPIMIVPLSWLGWRMEGAATFVRHSILDISVHMWYLNSMGSLHSPRPGYFSYKLCGQPAELCGVLQTFIRQFYLSSFVKKRKLCRDNDWNKLVCWDITDCCLHARPMVS